VYRQTASITAVTTTSKVNVGAGTPISMYGGKNNINTGDNIMQTTLI
jgi:glutamate-1-semialdehyde aminotransferase